MKLFFLKIFLLLGIVYSLAGSQEREGKVELSVRASAINPDAKEHPEINYTFAKVKDKYQDMQHAIVDTRVPPRDRLVIWLMSYNAELSEYLASLGLHLIQPHYANRWFSTVPKKTHDTGECLGNIRGCYQDTLRYREFSWARWKTIGWHSGVELDADLNSPNTRIIRHCNSSTKLRDGHGAGHECLQWHVACPGIYLLPLQKCS